MASEVGLAVSREPPLGWVRVRLREATAASHARVDSAYSAFDLTVTVGYRGFLQTQYACLEPLEARLTAAGAESLLPDWSRRRRAALLAADLADLGVTEPSDVCPLEIDLSSVGARLGALYVVEGSRFGGLVMARKLPGGLPARFLRATGPPHAWRALVEALDRHLGSDHELRAATVAAQAVFAAFETAARLGLETGVG